jgi:hypothetical protein
MSAGIDCDTYHDRVEIKMLGEKPITIMKPASVSLQEWNSFWRLKRPNAHTTYPPFTKEDAEANNNRRLANINR